MFLKLYSNNWSNFIVWLSLLCEILGNMCIAIAYFLDCDVISFEINLSNQAAFINDQKVKKET